MGNIGWIDPEGRMENTMADPKDMPSDELAAERTDLAIERTVMAANRTLMAWIRTALATISFGFTVYKILLSASSEKLNMAGASSPKRIGLFLIALGTVSVILGTFEYYHTMRHLDRMTTRVYKPLNFSTIIGALVGLLGIFLIVTMLLNLEVF